MTEYRPAFDATRLLNDLRLLARRRPDTTAAEQAAQVSLFARKLRGHDRRDVEAVLARTWKHWPDWAELEEALANARDDRAAVVRSHVAAAWQPDLNQAVNTAFGYLANAHLRELDRMRETDPARRQQIVNDCARWFQGCTSDALAASGMKAREPFRAMITDWVERQIGKTWRQILDEEEAARGGPPPTCAGFTSLGPAISSALEGAVE